MSQDLELYARVINGEVTEFPVYRIHIANREHPLYWYTLAKEDIKPEINKYQVLEQKYEVLPTHVRVYYEVRNKTLEELIKSTKEYGYTNSEGAYTPPSIADVPPELINLCYNATSDYITNILNDFAAQKGYGTKQVDPFTSLMTYLDSKVDQFKREAEKGRDYRDQIWAHMLSYYDGVLKGTRPVPSDVQEVIGEIPLLKWDD